MIIPSFFFICSMAVMKTLIRNNWPNKAVFHLGVILKRNKKTNSLDVLNDD